MAMCMLSHKPVTGTDKLLLSSNTDTALGSDGMASFFAHVLQLGCFCLAFNLFVVYASTMHMCVCGALPKINSAGDQPVAVCSTLRYVCRKSDNIVVNVVSPFCFTLSPCFSQSIFSRMVR